ncbi:C-terminal binding protein [Auraticoccus monumenti]|uniref:D-3-phosphoglycerate dehydrogenase n=1 Tax=Auraticoccus monumenti TaxID=675864 RepID=A0A1G7DZJ9_9ACTN|nr:C-terminal binding protein [Auraticoccus monumenti]SDE56889.1 D-3-phosphoglycerate dehydrogenase [Auraticoccus monumenti]
MRIVVTDCDHASVDLERQVVADAGGELVLNQTTAAEDVVAGAEGADALLVQYASITREVLEALPEVRVVSRYGVGVDTVDVAAATELGVAVCNVPDYGTEAVSDHAIALVVATIRGLGALDRGVRAGRYDLGSSSVLPIRQFSSQVLGVLGCGRIGAATARKAAALGFRVLVHDARLTEGSSTAEGWPVVALEQLLAESDVVSVHTPLVADTHHLLDAGAFAAMKRGAVLVNTSRGGVVDTDALVEALSSGQLHGAGLDVLEEEPVATDHPLTGLDNVILTPHTAFYSEESYGELKRRTAQNAVDVLRGEPRDVLNTEVLEAGRRP